MSQLTRIRDHIVPQVQMAPGINHPQQARAARARAAAQGLTRIAQAAVGTSSPYILHVRPAWAVGRAGVWLGGKQPCASLQEQKRRRFSGGSC